MKYVALLRGINVGGKNKIAMSELKTCFEKLDLTNVKTYINSGNVVFESNKNAKDIARQVETSLPTLFKLDSDLIKVHILSQQELLAIIEKAPKGFGAQPDTYHSDAILLMDITPEEALVVFSPKEGVDMIWPGNGVIYSQRLSAQRTRSRLGKIIGTVPYKSMTIRSWGTMLKLASLLSTD